MKFIRMLTPDGVTPFSFGPKEGRRHDSALLSMSEFDASIVQNEKTRSKRLACLRRFCFPFDQACSNRVAARVKLLGYGGAVHVPHEQRTRLC